MTKRSFAKWSTAAIVVTGLALMADRALTAPMPMAPHYFGPYPNYANSPAPSVLVAGNPLIARGAATSGAGNMLVVNPNVPLSAGTLIEIRTFNQVGSGPNAFNAYVLRPTGTVDQYDVVFDSGTLLVPSTTTEGEQVFAVTPFIVQAGDLLAFYGQGIPVDIPLVPGGTGGDVTLYPAPTAPLAAQTITLGGVDYPVDSRDRTYSIAAVINGGGGLRKFVDGLPQLTSAGKNNLNQYIPIAVADTSSYPGTDYYEIAVVQYREQMHSDLPATLLRGYVQLETAVNAGSSAHVALATANLDGTTTPILDGNGQPVYGVDGPHYLGPLISATRNKPVRILFRNLLPTGQGGDLFLPVDATVMGAGMGPAMNMAEMDPQNPMCTMTPKPMGCYTDNRATLHLHGGISPWISDGTPHQWITPADEMTMYPKGVSVQNVPDMPDPGPGAQTFFYTNQQSARLMFYHDHSWGITRLNVYAGEAAPYLVTDPMEQNLVAQGLLPVDQIPLVVQDKTFLPSPAALAMQDPNWDSMRWGGMGNLWVPHVYVPAQNPGDSSGVNQFGRWAYGPWFWPPTAQAKYGPIANPYFDPNCDTDLTWCEPPQIPGVPFLSMGMEAFNDTPVVNGTAYPTTTVDPKAYRLRILNGANDRFWNLQFYLADASGTEVALNPDEVAAALADQTIFPTPLASTAGPSWLQIGTEGGFLPAPVVIPNQPITWVNDPTVFNAGNVDQHSLLLGPAERADVIVDFTPYAGRTLILYNDAPAAFPARDPRYDYYTGNADLRETGGAAATIPGYGPNTRTVMQIRVNGTPGGLPPTNYYDPAKLAALETAFKAVSLGGQGVFAASQHPIIVGQGVYNSAYGSTFRTNAPRDGLVRITDFSFTFNTLLGQDATQTMTMPLQPKAIQDEMGESFDREYGRMSGNLGLETPGAQAGLQNLVLYPYVNPASEIFDGIELPPGTIDVTPIAAADDGTQIWKITHNGVDTHPIHFHLFDIQLINRVGWDGIIRRPDANELGWKETVRVSPLEDTIVAARPIIPKIPFGLVDSQRPLNPMMPLGSTEMFANMDANGQPINPPITNQVVNFGWEYVWHCHILSHEEMDMMRPMSVNVGRTLAAPPVLTVSGEPGTPIALSWTDGTPIDYVNPDVANWGDPANEIGFRIERAAGLTDPLTSIGSALANTTTFNDAATTAATRYRYRVVAYNAAGESPSNTVLIGPPLAPPAAPSNLTATLLAGAQVRLNWNDNSGNETGFRVERAVVTGGTPGAYAVIATTAADIIVLNDTTVAANTTYAYRVFAFNADGEAASNVATVTTAPAQAPPAAPTNLTATLLAGPQVRLVFRDNALSETGFVIERSDNSGAFLVVGTRGPRANTGTVFYTDATVTAGVTSAYRVKAVNLGASSAYSNVATISLAVPAAPSNFTATAVVSGATRATVTLAWTDNATNEMSFILQRASNAAFTLGLNNKTLAANSTTRVETRNRGRVYYYRIRAVNAVGSSVWVNAAPFPLITP